MPVLSRSMPEVPSGIERAATAGYHQRLRIAKGEAVPATGTANTNSTSPPMPSGY